MVKELSPSQIEDKFALKYEATILTSVSIAKGASLCVGTTGGVEKFNTKGGGF